uniref:Leucine Rich repeats-containing protein n=1 Tax=Trepomonas sp. PC1 TaxID=1076344 RepID=A0A146K2E8_9EUKA|eukprot:JAP90628.1 Leucine Rich repeats-containing protein [Trepomonas sp. PC1]
MEFEMVQSLNGIQLLKNLTDISLQHTNIKELKEFKELTNLEVVNLIGNGIENPMEILFLKNNFKLKSLFLALNPIFKPQKLIFQLEQHRELQHQTEELMLLNYPRVNFGADPYFEAKHEETWKRVCWRADVIKTAKKLKMQQKYVKKVKCRKTE